MNSNPLIPEKTKLNSIRETINENSDAEPTTNKKPSVIPLNVIPQSKEEDEQSIEQSLISHQKDIPNFNQNIIYLDNN